MLEIVGLAARLATFSIQGQEGGPALKQARQQQHQGQNSGEQGITVAQQLTVPVIDLAMALSVWRPGGLQLDLPLPIPDCVCSGLTDCTPWQHLH